ncbi:GGDEF domain-containing protein [Phreatobacter sp.]|uniref:GGDEF domain-containing protein n=1 Tax=Phreatobacter sp. TaxID=1966341 RepID=UPI0022C0DCD4|nr:GGDEF domain-containing protein [Phreatobacter sp.]MCZ8316741.1 GGDEF domain-containing protein [Phreatobacter sp.]
MTSILFRFPLLLGADVCDARQKQELIDEFFDHRPFLVAVVVMTLAILQVCFSGQPTAALMAAGLLACALVVRIGAAEAYRRYGRGGDERRWLRVFAATCVTIAILWGSTGAVLYLAADANMRLAVLAIGCVLIQAVTLRTYMAPGPTLAQVLILIAFHLPVLAADGLTVLVPICLLYGGFQAYCILQLGQVRLRQMHAERDALRLLDELQRTNVELTRANLRLAQSALSDPLTGIGNRRRFEEALGALAAAAEREGSALALLMIDVDGFKRFNDVNGHLAGDEALRGVAAVLQATAGRLGHVVARYGGEEFVVLMARGGLDEAGALAEEIRVTMGASGTVPLTVSIGVATGAPPEPPSALVARADAALYAAKRAGRDRVVVADADPDRDRRSA